MQRKKSVDANQRFNLLIAILGTLCVAWFIEQATVTTRLDVVGTHDQCVTGIGVITADGSYLCI